MKIAAGKFKAQCLRLMEDVQKRRQTVVITKRGKPVAKLVPPDDEPARTVFGFLQGQARIVGDIVSPVDVEWQADR
jgi:prevent-host-death family protein